MLSIMLACAEVQEMLAVARPLDLTQNIFQDGQWGTLRYAPSYRFPVSHKQSLSCSLVKGFQHACASEHAVLTSSPTPTLQNLYFQQLNSQQPSLLPAGYDAGSTATSPHCRRSILPKKSACSSAWLQGV